MARHKKKPKGHPYPSKHRPTPPPRSGQPRRWRHYAWIGLSLMALAAVVMIPLIWRNDGAESVFPAGPSSGARTTTPQTSEAHSGAETAGDAEPGWTEDLARLPDFISLADRATSPARIAMALKDEAIAVADLLIRRFPQEPEPYFLMGTLQRLRGSSESAIRYWNQGLALNPEHVDAFDGMAFLSLERGEYEKAISLWKRALKLAPRLPGAYNGIGRAYMALGQAEQAIAAFEKETEISPEDSLNFYLLGQQYFQVRQFDQARRQYEKAIALEPDMTNAYYGLAMALARTGARAESREYLQKFQELKDQDFAALEERDRQYDDLKQTREYAAKAHTEAGRLYFLRGGRRIAETVWLRAAELDPLQTTCRECLSLLYDQDDDQDTSIRYLRQLCELDPLNYEYRLTLGSLLRETGELPQAEAQFIRARELAPDDPTPLREQARLYLMANRNLPQALDLARKAIEMEPSARNYHLLGWVHERIGALDLAKEAIEKAIELEPERADYRRIHQNLIASQQE